MKPQVGDIWRYIAGAEQQYHFLILEKRKYLTDCYEALSLNGGTTMTIQINDTLDWKKVA